MSADGTDVMPSVHKAIAFIQRTGNALDRLRLRQALGETIPQAELEAVLSSYQFPDGSWDYSAAEEQTERIGSLGGTIHCLRWLREFGLGGRSQMSRTLEFLTSVQDSDGSFYETKQKLAQSPQEWLQKETLKDRFYFTAAVPMRLISLDHRMHPAIAPAIGWLEKHLSSWALVTATWYNLWALLCIYPEGSPFGAEFYQRCSTTALDWLPEVEAQPLTWLLDALHGSGHAADELLVTMATNRLVTLQNENGIWPSTQGTLAETAVTAIRLIYGNRVAPNHRE
jgi:hypothetical protein